MRVQIHKLNADLFETTMAQQVSLNTRQGFMWIIISLLDKSELFTLRLVQS
jgi:hypothetical protein